MKVNCLNRALRGIVAAAAAVVMIGAADAQAASLSATVSDLTYVFGGGTFPGTYPPVNLTTEGTQGWVEFGTGNAAGAASQAGINYAAAANAISNGQLSGITFAQTNYLNFREWSNGTPVASMPASSFDANSLAGSAAIFSFDVAPDGGVETLKVYVAGGALGTASGTFAATLKDNGGNTVASYTNAISGSGQFAKLYTVSFQDATPTDKLSISLNGASLGLDFATLSSRAAAPVPTPTAAAAGLALLGFAGVRRNRRG